MRKYFFDCKCNLRFLLFSQRKIKQELNGKRSLYKKVKKKSYVPFVRVDNQVNKLCVEIQRQKMIVQDVDAVQFVLQMRCYRNKFKS